MTGQPTQRLFAAVALDDATRAALLDHLLANGGGDLPGRHVPPSNWHVTLRFLGATVPEVRDRFLHELESHVSGGPFRLTLEALGAFPKPQRATVAWLGIGGAVGRLAELADITEDAAQAAGFAAEDRPFHAHLTLSRIRPAADVAGRIDAFPPARLPLNVERVVLYESAMGRGPAVYRVVDEVALGS